MVLCADKCSLYGILSLVHRVEQIQKSKNDVVLLFGEDQGLLAEEDERLLRGHKDIKKSALLQLQHVGVTGVTALERNFATQFLHAKIKDAEEAKQEKLVELLKMLESAPEVFEPPHVCAALAQFTAAEAYKAEAERRHKQLQFTQGRSLKDKQQFRAAQRICEEAQSKLDTARKDLETARQTRGPTSDVHKVEPISGLHEEVERGTPPEMLCSTADTPLCTDRPQEECKISDTQRISNIKAEQHRLMPTNSQPAKVREPVKERGRPSQSGKARGRTALRNVGFNAGRCEAEEAATWCEVEELDWSHDKIYDHFGDHRSLFESVCDLLEDTTFTKSEVFVSRLPPLKVVQLGPRRYSLSNRRLFVAKKYQDILRRLIGPDIKVCVRIRIVTLGSGSSFTTTNRGESVALSRPIKILFETHAKGDTTLTDERRRSLSEPRSRSGSRTLISRANPKCEYSCVGQEEVQPSSRTSRCDMPAPRKRSVETRRTCCEAFCTRLAALSCADRRGPCCRRHCTVADCPCHGAHSSNSSDNSNDDASSDIGIPSNNPFAPLQEVARPRRQGQDVHQERRGRFGIASPDRVRSLSRTGGRQRSKSRDLCILDRSEGAKVLQQEGRVDLPFGFIAAKRTVPAAVVLDCPEGLLIDVPPSCCQSIEQVPASSRR